MFLSEFLLEKFFVFNFRPAWYFLNECESAEWWTGDNQSLDDHFWSFSNFAVKVSGKIICLDTCSGKAENSQGKCDLSE